MRSSVAFLCAHPLLPSQTRSSLLPLASPVLSSCRSLFACCFFFLYFLCFFSAPLLLPSCMRARFDSQSRSFFLYFDLTFLGRLRRAHSRPHHPFKRQRRKSVACLCPCACVTERIRTEEGKRTKKAARSSSPRLPPFSSSTLFRFEPSLCLVAVQQQRRKQRIADRQRGGALLPLFLSFCLSLYPFFSTRVFHPRLFHFFLLVLFLLPVLARLYCAIPIIIIAIAARHPPFCVGNSPHTHTHSALLILPHPLPSITLLPVFPS